jgi:Mrp family chromosome partitioning ATPase
MAFDFFDQRIRCREELGAAVGGLGAEPIPSVGNEEMDPEFSKRQTLRSSNRASGPLRDLALRLILEHERGGAKIVSFVGTHRRTGNTSIALNVARAISSHGFDVLIAELPTPYPGLAAAAELSALKTPNSPWGVKVQDPSSAVEIIPWIPGVSKDQVRMTIDSFLSNAAKVYDFVLLDLVALPTSDISRETSVKSDVVVITAAQDIALYGDVRNAVDWIVAGGVPAVTTVLNFTRPDTFRLRVHQFSSLAGRKFSDLHDWFRNKVSIWESLLFSKLVKSTHYTKVADLLQHPSSPATSESQKDPRL